MQQYCDAKEYSANDNKNICNIKDRKVFIENFESKFKGIYNVSAFMDYSVNHVAQRTGKNQYSHPPAAFSINPTLAHGNDNYNGKNRSNGDKSPTEIQAGEHAESSTGVFNIAQLKKTGDKFLHALIH